MNPRGTWRLAALVVVALVTLGHGTAAVAAKQAFAYQGFNLMAFNAFDYADETLIAKSLDYIVDSGSNFVVVDWNVAVDDDGKVLPQTSTRTFEPPRTDVVRVVTRARQRGLKVFLKPHVGFPDDMFANRGTWNTDMTKFSLATFFADWTRYLVALGPLANSLGVDGLVIGSENIGFDSANRPQWLALIASVRQSFNGKIAYEAHFGVQSPWEVTNVSFWDAVDIIGFSLYVALSKNDQASLQELNAAWHSNPYGMFGDIVEFMRGLSTRYNKPVMAFEGGYQSIAGGLFDVGPVGEGRPVSNAVQAAGFASYLDTLGKYQGDWFWGLSIWAVYPPMMDAANQNTWGYRQGYMTNGKPAADVIRRYFTTAVTYSDPWFAGTDAADILYASYADDSIAAGAGDDFIWTGEGNNTVSAGPSTIVRKATARVVVTANGDVTPSGGPKVRLSVNGHAAGNYVEVTAAANQPAQPIVFDVPLDGTGRIDRFVLDTQPDPEFSQGVNRRVFVKAIAVNGSPLAETDGTYTVGASVVRGVGSWTAMWSGTTLSQDVVEKQALFFGAATDSDVIAVGSGNNVIDGGAGVDAVVFSGRYADYTIATTATGASVTSLQTGAMNTLMNVELLQFSDRLVDLRSGTRITPVVEFYNASLDHYFITWLPAERTNLYRRGTPTAWVPTGLSFDGYTDPLAGASPVCRYYLPPAFGDSHFFGRGAAECAATGQAHPQFVLEDERILYMVLPSAGVCPGGTRAVFRLFSNRADANHRYTTDPAVRDAMVAKGWVAEGDGPDRVAMCAPVPAAQ